jgi:hypothetical protein
MDKKAFSELLKGRQGKPAPKSTIPPPKDEPDDRLDKPFACTGTAKDAAMGAVVVADGGGVYYLDGMQSWPKDAFDKQVEVKGTLRRKKLAPDPTVDEDGMVSHGMLGSSLVIEDAVWTLSS